MSGHAYAPSYIYWELCDTCNLRCRHCFENSGPENHFFADRDRLLHKILEITRRGPVPIRFGGGEPLLYPGLFELLEDCQRHHIPIDMTTNGTLLDSEAAKRLKQCGLRTLTVSIDGTKPYHDGLRGGGNFARAYWGMENALQAGNHVSVAFTATAYNYKNISDYTEFFHRKGIREFYIFRYIPDPSGVRTTELELDAQMLMETTAAIHTAMERYPDSKFSYEKKGHLDFLLTGRSSSAFCRFAKGILTVKSDGTVVVCAAISKSLGNLYTDSLDEIFANVETEIQAIGAVPEECITCPDVGVCGGGCKCYSYGTYGDYLHADSGCYRALLPGSLGVARQTRFEKC